MKIIKQLYKNKRQIFLFIALSMLEFLKLKKKTQLREH